jgi:site-specific DNA recombinase
LPSPLAGKLFDENSEPLYSQRTARGGRTYRYYVSRELIRSPAADVQAGWRVPAPELERAVIGAACGILDDKQAVLAELQDPKSNFQISAGYSS